MAKNETPIIVGVFQDRKRAEEAYNELDRIGFGKDYLGFAEPGDGGKGLLKQFENVGVPVGDAQFYAHEYDAGRTLVTVRAGGLPESSIEHAITILKKYGAYDATSRGSSQDEFGSNVNRSAQKPFFDTTPLDTTS
ncbi:MAG TPA: hypothetical protein VKV20_19265 [Ktedonobacteraceae bacterium]|jgi:hypothetical protein|nr:hypothetical protein [Ktedonobacteraceae bacterium]